MAVKAPKREALDLREAIGRRYLADYTVARGEHMVAYAKATNDLNPRYLDSDRDGGIVASPIFAVRLVHPLMMQCVGDPEIALDMLMLVHGEQDMRWYGPLRPGDIVNLRGELSAVAQKSKGCIVQWRMVGFVEGELRVEAMMTVFVRGQQLAGVEPGAIFGTMPSSGAGPIEGEPCASQSMVVAADQPLRYAAASLDDNPIHMDESVAKAAGHPSTILHGLCTMAFGAKAVVDELAGGDSSRLRRFAVRFSKPVLPGWTLTTSMYAVGELEDGAQGYRVEMKNQDGDVVISKGWAELR